MSLFLGIIIFILAAYLFWSRREIANLESDALKWQTETKNMLQIFNELTTELEHEQILSQELKALIVDHIDIFKDVIHANQVHTGKRGSSILRPETLSKLRSGIDQATENGWFDTWRRPLDVEGEATETTTEVQ